jgi:hypothetical protein
MPNTQRAPEPHKSPQNSRVVPNASPRTVAGSSRGAEGPSQGLVHPPPNPSWPPDQSTQKPKEPAHWHTGSQSEQRAKNHRDKHARRLRPPLCDNHQTACQHIPAGTKLPYRQAKSTCTQRGESTGDRDLPEPSPGHLCPGRPHQRHNQSL